MTFKCAYTSILFFVLRLRDSSDVLRMGSSAASEREDRRSMLWRDCWRREEKGGQRGKGRQTFFYAMARLLQARREGRVERTGRLGHPSFLKILAVWKGTFKPQGQTSWPLSPPLSAVCHHIALPCYQTPYCCYTIASPCYFTHHTQVHHHILREHHFTPPWYTT